MRKTLLLFLLCCGCMPLCAQSGEHWSRGLGVRAGIGVASMHGNRGFDTSIARFQAGISYEFLLKKSWGLETGLYFNTKGGAETNMIETGEKIESKLSLWYLQLPILCNYHVRLRDFSIVPFAGVYYGYCLKGTLNAQGKSVSWLKEDGTGSKRLRRSDFGLRLGCGFTYRHLYLSLGYDLGLSNIAQKYLYYNGERLDTKPNWKRRTGSFITTVGWNF